MGYQHVFNLNIDRSYEGTLDGDMSGPADMYYWGGGAPLAQGERGSMASLDSTLRKGPATGWRQPELPEVIAMLNYRLDPVKSNAAAFLQHLTYKNDKVRNAPESEYFFHYYISSYVNGQGGAEKLALSEIEKIVYARSK